MTTIVLSFNFLTLSLFELAVCRVVQAEAMVGDQRSLTAAHVAGLLNRSVERAFGIDVGAVCVSTARTRRALWRLHRLGLVRVTGNRQLKWWAGRARPEASR